MRIQRTLFHVNPSFESKFMDVLVARGMEKISKSFLVVHCQLTSLILEMVLYHIFECQCLTCCLLEHNETSLIGSALQFCIRIHQYFILLKNKKKNERRNKSKETHFMQTKF